MASYRAVTPIVCVEMGGNYDGETGTQMYLCVKGSTARNSAWLHNHGMRYNNTTGFAYNDDQILVADDILPITQPVVNKTYEFINMQTYDPLYIIRTDIHCISNWIGTLPPNTVGATIEQNTNTQGYVYYPSDPRYDNIYSLATLFFRKTVNINVVPYYVIDGRHEPISNFTWHWNAGVTPASLNGQQSGSLTLFVLTSVIVLDFNGQNCRNAYFSCWLGKDESGVRAYARGETPSGNVGFGGFSPKNMCGFNNKNYLNNGSAEVVKCASGQEYNITPYKSVDSVWVSNIGFTVIFKDTAEENSEGYEVFVVGYDLDNNTWDTDNYGYVFVIKNFKMS